MKKPQSTQKHGHRAADGHVHRSPEPHDPHRREASPEVQRKHNPTGNHMPADFGSRMAHRDVKRLSGISLERTRNNANRLTARFTKFIQNFHGQLKMPRDLIHPDRHRAGEQDLARGCIDVGQVPED